MSKAFFAGLARWPECVAAGPFLFFGGRMGLRGAETPYLGFDELKGIGPGPGSPFAWVNRMEGPVGAQATAIYNGYENALRQQHGSLEHLVRFHLYQRDKRFFPVFDRVRRHYEPQAPAPSTAVGMGRFEPNDRARFLIDAIALNPRAVAQYGARQAHAGAAGQRSAAHFSHVVQGGPFLFVAGQIPIDTSRPGAPLIRGYEDVPEEGRFLSVGRSHEDGRNGPIAAQTWFTYDVIRQHLASVGAGLGDILNLVVYLQDMRDFPTFHRVHERFFKGEPPALTVVQVGEVGHKGTLIEIEPTAVVPGAHIERHAVPLGTSALAHMSAAVEAAGIVFLSGIPGTGQDGAPATDRKDLPPECREFVRTASPGRSGIAALQTAAALGQLRGRLAKLRCDLSSLVHLTLFLKDIEDFVSIGRVLQKAFGKNRPALTVAEVPQPAPVADVRVSITAIAAVHKRF